MPDGPAAEPGARGAPVAAAPALSMNSDDGLGAFLQLRHALGREGVGDGGVDGDAQQQQHQERRAAAEQHQPPADAADHARVPRLLAPRRRVPAGAGRVPRRASGGGLLRHR